MNELSYTGFWSTIHHGLPTAFAYTGRTNNFDRRKGEFFVRLQPEQPTKNFETKTYPKGNKERAYLLRDNCVELTEKMPQDEAKYIEQIKINSLKSLRSEFTELGVDFRVFNINNNLNDQKKLLTDECDENFMNKIRDLCLDGIRSSIDKNITIAQSLTSHENKVPLIKRLINFLK